MASDHARDGGPFPRQPRVIRPHRERERTDAPEPEPEPESPQTGMLVLPDADADAAELPTTRQPVLGPPALPQTAPLPRDGRPPTEAQVDALKRSWLRMPLWDIEYQPGFECEREHLAAWHQEQLHQRAQLLGAGPLMIAVVEELARCWIDATPPRSERARQLLRVFG